MNYRHIYHAGNFADVFKHVALAVLLDHLRLKDKGFFVLDTHGGIGLYDLHSPEAQKTTEFVQGIGAVWDAAARTPDNIPQDIRVYLDIVRRFNRNTKESLRYYPGSPLIIRDMLRPQDRAIVAELHPEDVKFLRRGVGSKDDRLRVVHDDGYMMMKALLPPPERRGLVVTDPPFEDREEFKAMIAALKEGYKRWETGIYMMWYPIKDPSSVRNFYGALAASGIRKIHAFEFLRHPVTDVSLFNGCGLAVINPPWTMAARMDKMAPWLLETMTGGKGLYNTTIVAED